MEFMPDSFRTRLRDILFGRPRIALLSQQDLDVPEAPPIFLIGTFRSGTTIIRYLLDSHSRICCSPETKFLTHLAAMCDDKSLCSAVESMGLKKSYLLDQCKHFSNNFFNAYRVSKGKARWADKTPEYVRILDFIEELYGPHCQYVLIYRNGLDVAHSMISVPIEPLEPDKTIEKAFEYWKKDTEIMHTWESRYPDRCFIVRYEALCLDLESTLHTLFDFLGEQWEDGVLQWYKKCHDRGYEDIKARRQCKINISYGNFHKWDIAIQKNLKQRSRHIHEAIDYNPDSLLPR